MKITKIILGIGISVVLISIIVSLNIFSSPNIPHENIDESLPNTEIQSIPEPKTVAKSVDVIDDPIGAGTLGNEHSHAAILVKILGDDFDFSLPEYQIKSSWIHFEGRDGSTIHKHASGVTLGYLFDTLGLNVDEQCFGFQDGRKFCTNEDYSLKFYVNAQQVTSIRNYELQDDDRILISYGGETQYEITQQLAQLYSQNIIK